MRLGNAASLVTPPTARASATRPTAEPLARPITVTAIAAASRRGLAATGASAAT
jgi:hypothetical protein